jgi:hypothetical protein
MERALEKSCMHKELQCTTQRALEEAHGHEEVKHARQKALKKEHVCEELRCMTQEETKHNTYAKTELVNQVSDLLHCCTKMLGDPVASKKLTHMLARCMEEGENNVVIYAPLPE